MKNIITQWLGYTKPKLKKIQVFIINLKQNYPYENLIEITSQKSKNHKEGKIFCIFQTSIEFTIVPNKRFYIKILSSFFRSHKNSRKAKNFYALATKSILAYYLSIKILLKHQDWIQRNIQCFYIQFLQFISKCFTFFRIHTSRIKLAIQWLLIILQATTDCFKMPSSNQFQKNWAIPIGALVII